MENIYCVVRPQDSVIVSIMFNESDNSYHFVNLSYDHICKCAFKTVEDALKDMNKQIKIGKVLSYYKINNTTKERS